MSDFWFGFNVGAVVLIIISLILEKENRRSNMEDLYIKKDKEFVKIKSIENIDNSDILIFKMDRMMSRETIINLECELSYKTKKVCIVLDSSLEKIYGVKNG